MLTTQLTATLRHSMVLANERRHEFATTEHLLLALLDDPDALDVLRGCGADLEQQRRKLTDFIDHDLQPLAVDGTAELQADPWLSTRHAASGLSRHGARHG